MTIFFFYGLTGYLVQDVWHELADDDKDHDVVEEDGPFQPVLVLRTKKRKNTNFDRFF